MDAPSSYETYQPTQEIRFASVMFGGVSLAIYMNGITQELLRAVRATAPASGPEFGANRQATDWQKRRYLNQLVADEEIADTTESVYRTLGRSLFHGRAAGTEKTVTGPIRTRIVVDLLAGTSAGGINSVFLAKALVNNQKLDELHRLWMSEADIDTLLNGSGAQKTSLLDSNRMYDLLYDAFNAMDQNAPGNPLPLADEVDLFVTTTDLDGVATPIQLADQVIEERVHKASFHFIYGAGRPGSPNDFSAAFNPMLAFASRCTSSFPIAFEPMKLENMDRRFPGLSVKIQEQGHFLHKFFDQFERDAPGISTPAISFVERPLADGGYLNNKPFSFIVDQIRLRTGTVPVRRKLLFLDPSPVPNSRVQQNKKEVNFLENALDAAYRLPGYQTIREDIERLNEYNRSIHAAQLLAREIEADSSVIRVQAVGPVERQTDYPKRTLTDLAAQFGVCYRTYHRLRVSAVTSELATLVTRLLRMNERSDNLFAIRMLIHAWCIDHYSPDGKPNDKGKRELETLFLARFDLGFRFRRAEYVRARIDDLLSELSGSGDGLPALLKTVLPEAWSDEAVDSAAELLRGNSRACDELLRLRDEIEFVKWRLVYERERLYIESTRSVGGPSRRDSLMKALEDTKLGPVDLAWILRPVEDDECQKRADALYRTGLCEADDADNPVAAATARPVKQNIEKAANILQSWYGEILGFPVTEERRGNSFTASLNRAQEPDLKGSATALIKEYVWIHYQYFDCRDMQVFTVMQDQLSGEGSPVEIYRISPLDAVELRPAADKDGENKLAGTALFAFGAFLSKAWRHNDIMWGRLDGAERIIGSLLPDEKDNALRRELCEQAFEIIVREEFGQGKSSDMIRPLIDYLKGRVKPGGMTADEFLEAVRRDSEREGPEVIRQLLKSIPQNDNHLAAFRAYYVKPADPPLKDSLNRLRRALRIFGAMLRTLDQGNGPFTSIGGTVVTFAAALTRFVEFSIPQTLGNMFFRYLLQMLYAIAVVLIVTGAFVYRDVKMAGWIILGATAIVHLLSWMVVKWLTKPKTQARGQRKRDSDTPRQGRPKAGRAASKGLNVVRKL